MCNFTEIGAVFIARKTADDGTDNTFGPNSGIAAFDFEAAIANTDPSKRWVYLPAVEEVAFARAEAIKEEAPSGNKYFVRDANRTFSGMVMGGSPQLLESMELVLKCKDVVFYGVRQDGSLVGLKDSAGTSLLPFNVSKGSLSMTYNEPTGGNTVAKIMVSFDLTQDQKDAHQREIPASSIATALLGLRSAQLATATLVAGTSKVTLTTATQYGNYASPDKVLGLLTANFTAKLRNVTQSTTITVTASEVSPGVYDLTYSTGVTTGDSLKLLAISAYPYVISESNSVTAL